jgi:GH15 family glucan-1,4-alpha-glucosidase
VPLRWRVEPRFVYGGARTQFSSHSGVPVAAHGRDAVAVAAWNAGDPRLGPDAVEGRFESRAGEVGHVVLAAAHQEPIVIPSRDDVEARLGGTVELWRSWAEGREYEGRWPEAVLRSALALKLLVFVPSGAIAAAPTTSLPEELGGIRNWDYRYSWPRDASFAVRALLALGCDREATAFFWWLLHASQLNQPKVRSLYCLDGGSEADESALPLDGYRGSRPVRSGNAAATQSQLDVYGDVFDAAAELAARSGGLDRDHAKRLAAIADFVCDAWNERDSGIWEARSEPQHYTQSKMMCFVALDRACALADEGLVQGDAERWRGERERIREFVDERCWSETKQSYVCSADDDALDASLLVAAIAGFGDPRAPRLVATVDRIRADLGRGPLVHRYAMDDGLEGEEGAFLACSFWLAEAYALQGRVDEAVSLMDELVGLANDVGLYSEEIDAATGDFLGNFPQGLSHLALINAAVAIERAER